MEPRHGSSRELTEEMAARSYLLAEYRLLVRMVALWGTDARPLQEEGLAHPRPSSMAG